MDCQRFCYGYVSLLRSLCEMKIRFENLGVLKFAEFEVGDLTVICGKNNTGKTYAVYALYGFLKLWKDITHIPIDSSHIDSLMLKGSTSINLEEIKVNAETALSDACQKYSKIIHKVFSSREERFSNTEFHVELDQNAINPCQEFQGIIRSGKNDIISLNKSLNSDILEIIWLQKKEHEAIPRDVVISIINDALLDMFFSPILPSPFIASAERTGAAIFRKELDFARNRLLDEMGGMGKTLDPFKLMHRVYASYPLAVKDTVDFTRDFQNVVKNDSFLVKEYPGLLHEFHDMIGGEYRVMNEDLYFVAKKSRARLTMDESSSAVRSLVSIGMYLKHMAQRGDMLMVDEPELNLHPENQRRLARLFARLTNIGIKIFMTTHSDYIVKELNTLIMFNALKEPQRSELMKSYKYNETEILSVDKIRVYNAGPELLLLPGSTRKSKVNTLTPADISPILGIEVKDFDVSILEMTKIQDDILSQEGLE